LRSTPGEHRCEAGKVRSNAPSLLITDLPEVIADHAVTFDGMTAREQSLKRSEGKPILRMVVLAARTSGQEYKNDSFTHCANPVTEVSTNVLMAGAAAYRQISGRSVGGGRQAHSLP
jgi:hypothetical protein